MNNQSKAQETSLRQAARIIGVPYMTVMAYDMRIPTGLPTRRAGRARLISPDVLKRTLVEAGYHFPEEKKTASTGN